MPPPPWEEETVASGTREGRGQQAEGGGLIAPCVSPRSVFLLHFESPPKASGP